MDMDNVTEIRCHLVIPRDNDKHQGVDEERGEKGSEELLGLRVCAVLPMVQSVRVFDPACITKEKDGEIDDVIKQYIMHTATGIRIDEEQVDSC
jgi:hypothetical protein